MFEDYPEEEFDEEVRPSIWELMERGERRRSPTLKLAESVFRELETELPPISRSESTAEEYLKYLNKKREACEALLEKKQREKLEHEHEEYLRVRKEFQDSRENLKKAVAEFASANSKPVHRRCRLECDDGTKNYTLWIESDYPEDVVNKLLAKAEHIFCIEESEQRLEYSLVSAIGEVYHVIAVSPNEPVKYEDLKKFVLGMIDNEIADTRNHMEKDKEFDKLIGTIVDDGIYRRMRNESQRLFYLTHKYNLSRKDARYIMDMLAVVQAMKTR